MSLTPEMMGPDELRDLMHSYSEETEIQGRILKRLQQILVRQACPPSLNVKRDGNCPRFVPNTISLTCQECWEAELKTIYDEEYTGMYKRIFGDEDYREALKIACVKIQNE